MLEPLTARGRRPRLVPLLRDILDSPEATTPVWRKNCYYEAISAYYDEVLVVGTPEVFDLGLEYAFRRAASKITYCGYISPAAAAGSAGRRCARSSVSLRASASARNRGRRRRRLRPAPHLPEALTVSPPTCSARWSYAVPR